MAYLDRQLSEYRMSASPINRTIPEQDSPPPQIINQTAEAIKNTNHQLAKQVADTKADLVKSLALLPICALRLIDKYEKSSVTADEDQEDTTSDLALTVAGLTTVVHQFHQHSQIDNNGNDVSLACRQRLASQVQLFPFSFEDLTEMARLVVYRLKQAVAEGYSFSHIPNEQAKLLTKRLQGAQLKEKADGLQNFTACMQAQYGTAFLWSAHNDALIEVLLAEQRWLKARENLVTANNKLVSFIVNQYRGCFLEFNDLVQEGHTGLLKAVDRFDYRLGFQFSTYAGYWIRQAISRALSRNERSVRIPCEQIANIHKVFRAKDKLTSQVGREPSIQEIAEHTQLSCDDINTILAFSQAAIPLESTEDDDSEKTFAPVDFLEQQIFTHPIEEIAESELLALINTAITALNPREAKIVCSHFGLQSDSQMTLQEIGDELNLTRERIRQIQVMALNKIKLAYGQQLINFL